MKYFLLLMLCAAFGAAKEFDHGDCDSEWFLVEISYCQIQFVVDMNSSTNAFGECSKIYSAATACFEKRIVAECFPVNTTNAEDIKKIEKLREDFGDEDYFCKYGFLSSMKMILEETTLKNCENDTNKDYEVCETPFRDVFHEEFGETEKDFERLSKAYKEGRSCQFRLAASCKIPYRADTKFFTADEFLDPYDEKTIKTVTEAADKIEHGDHLDNQNATYIALVVVGVLLIAGIVATVFFFRRRDRDRAEIRRQKSVSKEQAKDNSAQDKVEMEPLSGNGASTSDPQASSA